VEGKIVALDDCPAAKTCLRDLSAYQLALEAVDRAIIVGAPLAAVDDPAAETWLTAALKTLEQALALAKTAGMMEGQ
jgi:hypothetical protein